ncbi:Perilipin family [Nesidiocoris tenuis]|uniref:Perilipin family n=1 Tax=Nesidiocoris tenuis TaxID=355587 RepID=A0ABN7ACH3_9HEMI|nr:Perilipin family [Nesidiocoris tenuis]
MPICKNCQPPPTAKKGMPRCGSCENAYSPTTSSKRHAMEIRAKSGKTKIANDPYRKIGPPLSEKLLKQLANEMMAPFKLQIDNLERNVEYLSSKIAERNGLSERGNRDCSRRLEDFGSHRSAFEETADTIPMAQPQLQVFDKLMQIPLANLAYNTSAGVYQKVKGCNNFIGCVLDTAEGAAALAISAVAPVANKFQGPIQAVDSTLCMGIDALQDKVPMVKEPPSQIVENAMNYVSNSAAVEKVQNITNVSWEKANEVLTTTTVGTMTLNGLDKTSDIADRVIDYVLPAGEDEDNVHPHPSSECDDKVLHAAHTVGALSAKMTRRVVNTIVRRHSSANIRRPSQESEGDDSSVHSSDEE